MKHIQYTHDARIIKSWKFVSYKSIKQKKNRCSKYSVECCTLIPSAHRLCNQFHASIRIRSNGPMLIVCYHIENHTFPITKYLLLFVIILWWNVWNCVNVVCVRFQNSRSCDILDLLLFVCVWHSFGIWSNE